jgi:hypothetical protein
VCSSDLEKSVLSDKQFINYCQEAIKEMKVNSKYHEHIAKMLAEIPEDKLAALMLAVAKQESGGNNSPIGSLALHRWEPAQGAFSFTYYHVLMKEAGLEARKKLGLTEGQACHPKNASKLFLAFLIEKTKDRGKLMNLDQFVAKNFPPSGSFQKFAAFYNGGDYKRNEYDTKLEGLFRESEKLLANANRKDNATPEKPEIAAKPKSKIEKKQMIAAAKNKTPKTFFDQAKEALSKLFE